MGRLGVFGAGVDGEEVYVGESIRVELPLSIGHIET